MLDNFQNYSDGVGSSLNPLLGYAQSAYELGRAAIGYEVISNGPTGAVVTIDSTEPVLLSPFTFGDNSYDTPGLIGVNSMTYYATLGNVQRCLSLIQNQGVTGISITNTTVEIVDANLQFLYLTPQPNTSIPRSLVNSYYSAVDFPTQSLNTYAPGDTIQIPMSSIQLNGIPKRLVIFAGQNATTLSQDKGFISDTYLSLAQNSPIVLTWNNNQFLASYTNKQLYDLSVSNGYDGSYAQWSKYRGSVLVLEFGKDIGLMPDQAPGLGGNFQLQVNASFTNTNPTQTIANPTLHCVVIYEGIFAIDNGSCSTSINMLNRDQVLSADLLPSVKFTPSKDIYGGDFFQGLRNFFSEKVLPLVKESKIASNLANLIPFVGPAVSQSVKNLGYGVRKPKMRGGAALSGGRTLASRIRGAGLTDGLDEDEEITEEEYDE
jgi:hypothetical protein